MVEPITTIGAGAIAAYLGKDGLQKLLGPTSEYLGNELRDFTRRRFETVGKIFQNASGKLGEELNEPGAVPPKVLKQVIDDGSFADDAVEVDYLGGVVASSRSETSRDNRGASIAKLIDSLSNYQLRSHFLIYSTARQLFREANLKFSPKDRPKMKMFMPIGDFVPSLDLSIQEINKLQALFTHIFFGLAKHQLIEDHWMFGQAEDIKSLAPQAQAAGIVCTPSANGVELFLWAFGRGQDRLEHLFSDDLEPTIEGLPSFIPGSIAVSAM